MPTYEFICKDCNQTVEFKSTFAELDSNTPKECEHCHSPNMAQLLFPPNVSVPHTVGHLADKRVVSLDEQESLKPKHKPAWVCDGDKIVHTSQT